jgi:hypothetical protein
MMYSIIGVWQGCMPEELDTAETKQDAMFLVREYRMAFGSEWNISIKRNKQ